MISQADIEMLTPEDKLQLVGTIWVTLASKPEDVPVSQAEKLLLEERWTRNTQNPSSTLTLEEFKRLASDGE